jgi:copper resistance protein B
MSVAARTALLAAICLSPLNMANAAEHVHDQHVQSAGYTAESTHVPPAPPTQEMPPMSNAEMIDVMGMDDDARFGKLSFDRLEYVNASEKTGVWKLDGWYGGDRNKARVRSQGAYAQDEFDEAEVELLWDRTVSRWWHLQTGVRFDSGEGPSRTWAAAGFEGLAPYWFDLEAMLYVGDAGRTALRIEATHDLLITRRLILQTALETNAYGKDDTEAGIGSGLADGEIGLRLRYEIRREIAPYVGVQWTKYFGETGDLVRSRGDEDSEISGVAGFRIWF